MGKLYIWNNGYSKQNIKTMATTDRRRGYKINKKNLLILVCILTVALVTAACGSSDDKDQSTA